MFYRLIRNIRERFHPLYELRRNPTFVNVVLPKIDVPLKTNLYAIRWPVYLKLVQHMSLILDWRMTEPGVASLMVALSEITHPKRFWDVGANVGVYSWLMMSLDKDLQATLFEPDPSNVALIERTIATSHLSNAKLIAMAISNSEGQANFALDRASGLTGSLMTESSVSERLYGYRPSVISVPTTTLDAIYRQYNQTPDLIKIDVETAEHLVFAGAVQLLKQTPTVIFECSTANRTGLIELLGSLGYEIISADAPNSTVDSAANLLALPHKHLKLLPALLDAWRREFKTWNRN